jgi:hypothetical protein
MSTKLLSNGNAAEGRPLSNCSFFSSIFTSLTPFQQKKTGLAKGHPSAARLSSVRHYQ